jgi:site-specific DNA-methyltransferase (adenine-specific)
MIAFALRDAGWYLRDAIIWNKENPMPESVKDRCTMTHEYIFMLSRSKKYYYDHEAISEPCVKGYAGSSFTEGKTAVHQFGASKKPRIEGGLRNKRSVWTVNTEPYHGAHFATYPQKLIVPCIKAGCPEGGIVIDPFAGTGTTAVVSRKLNRNFIIIELNPASIKLAETRLRDELGMWL